MLTGPSCLSSVAASAVMTVFDAGRRRSVTDEALAAYDYQVAAYRENVLTGFRQVEDNLAAVGPFEFSGATGMLWQACEQQFQLTGSAPLKRTVIRFYLGNAESFSGQDHQLEADEMGYERQPRSSLGAPMYFLKSQTADRRQSRWVAEFTGQLTGRWG